jgi:6-phosphogluconolactonase (cycloisomerase 2 family)
MKTLLRILAILCVAMLAGPVISQVPEGLTGTLIVLNKAGNDASFIDLTTGETVATLPTGTDPHELVVTADGRWAVATNYRGGNSLTVFDVRNLSVARTIDLSAHPAPHGLLLMRGDEHVIVTTEGSDQLIVVDFQNGDIEKVIETGQPGSHMVALSEDGSMAFTANTQGNSVSVIDVEAGETLDILDVPLRPEAIGANRSTTDVWVGSNDEGTVSVIDPADGSIRRQLTGFSWPYRILLTRDERQVVIPDARSEVLRVFDAESGEELGSLDFSGGGPQGVALHPDDRTLFLSLSRQGRVAVVDIESMQVLGEYAAGRGPDGIGYSELTAR